MKKINKYTLYKALGIAGLFLIWQLSSVLYGQPYILPGPVDTLRESIKLITSNEFFIMLGMTTVRVYTGFVISLLAAVILGIPAGLNKSFSSFLKPFIVLFRSTPVMSVILLTLILFSSSFVPVIVCILMAFPILYTGIQTSVQNVPYELVEMGNSFDLSKARMIKNIYIPAILPQVFGAMVTAIGISWKVVVAAEVLARPLQSIGAGLYDAKVLIETSRVFAWTFVAIIMSAISEAILILLKRRFEWK